MKHVRGIGHIRIIFAVKSRYRTGLDWNVPIQHIMCAFMGDGKSLSGTFPGIQQELLNDYRSCRIDDLLLLTPPSDPQGPFTV